MNIVPVVVFYLQECQAIYYIPEVQYDTANGSLHLFLPVCFACGVFGEVGGFQPEAEPHTRRTVDYSTILPLCSIREQRDSICGCRNLFPL